VITYEKTVLQGLTRPAEVSGGEWKIAGSALGETTCEHVN